MREQPSHSIAEYSRHSKAIGHKRGNRKVVSVTFTETVFEQINAEALKRQWSFSRMVVHLCEASIEGIE